MTDRSEDGYSALPDCGDVIDPNTFEQILEMDDEDDDREFSRGIVYGFFDQALATFENMDACIASRDLRQLSELGHFLKGSSATLGLTQVKDSCEKIQNYGAMKNEAGDKDVQDAQLCLDNIAKTLAEVRVEYAEAERRLRNFYEK